MKIKKDAQSPEVFFLKSRCGESQRIKKEKFLPLFKET